MLQKIAGALLIPYTPRPGTVWTLHDVLPRQGEEYAAVITRQWHEEDRRSFVEVEREGGERAVFEVWVRRERQ